MVSSMINIYKHFFFVTWAELWQYRANMLMYLLYWLVSPVIYLAVWTSIAAANGSVNGYTVNDFITYYLTLLVVDQLTSNITVHILAHKIKEGTISSELSRPIHPVLSNTLVYNIANKGLALIGFIPVWIILFVLFKPDFSAVTLGNVLLAIPAMLLGFVIGFLLSAAITCIAFWTTHVYSIHEIYFSVLVMFSGQFVPLTLMPSIVQTVSEYLPFQMMIYFPIQMILGRLTQPEIIRGYIVGGVWLVISILFFNFIWKSGLKQYSAVGA